MKTLLVAFLLFILVLSITDKAHSGNTQEAQILLQTHKRVLFVGNSFSFYNNGVHNHLGNLIRVNGEWTPGENRLRLLTLSGGHIHEQVEALKAHLKSDKHGYTAVVLQGHSNESILKSKSARFNDALKTTVDVVKEQGLEPFLFMTWAYKNTEGMYEKLAQSYEQAGAKLKVSVVPVGLAFERARTLLPDIDLYVPDILGVDNASHHTTLIYRDEIKHPSVAGTYLAALVFYAFFFDVSPQGIPYHAGLPKDVATRLQTLSWKVVSDYSLVNKNKK